MGSLIASYLVAALVNAVVEAAVVYSAAIEPAPPAALTLDSPTERQSAITHIDRPELSQLAQPRAYSSQSPGLLPFHGLSLGRTQINDLVRGLRAAEHSAEHFGASVPTVPVVRSLIGNAVHIEMPRMEANGQFVRPKIIFGLDSPEMKSWLRSHGVGAENCMFPMLRARARLNQQSREASAGVTLYARCSFY